MLCFCKIWIPKNAPKTIAWCQMCRSRACGKRVLPQKVNQGQWKPGSFKVASIFLWFGNFSQRTEIRWCAHTGDCAPRVCTHETWCGWLFLMRSLQYYGGTFVTWVQKNYENSTESPRGNDHDATISKMLSRDLTAVERDAQVVLEHKADHSVRTLLQAKRHASSFFWTFNVLCQIFYTHHARFLAIRPPFSANRRKVVRVATLFPKLLIRMCLLPVPFQFWEYFSLSANRIEFALEKTFGPWENVFFFRTVSTLGDFVE